MAHVRVDSLRPADDTAPTRTPTGPVQVVFAELPPNDKDTALTVNDDDREARIRNVDRSCWSTFLIIAIFVVSAVLTAVYSVVNFAESPVELHSPDFYVLCWLGGAFAGSGHFIFVPIDLVKCRMQVGEYASVADGFASLRREAAQVATVSAKVGVFFRGWVPTMMGYWTQGGAKFASYEFLKYAIASQLSYEFVAAHGTLIFLVSSALAELFADLFLAPWEALKVKMQTSRQYPPKMHVVMPRVWAQEGLRGYFKGLGALWCRQVPYNVVKFTTFENTVRLQIYLAGRILGHPPPQTGGLVVLFAVVAGYTAGTCCTIVSHPADTIISKLNQRQDSKLGAVQMIQQMPCRDIWRGLPLRIFMIGSITAIQWMTYDGFKYFVGLPTTGRAPVPTQAA